jgi:hypothetical protein
MWFRGIGGDGDGSKGRGNRGSRIGGRFGRGTLGGVDHRNLLGRRMVWRERGS